jgi:hypothetical protein
VIWLTLSEGSFRIAVFTLVVIKLSSTYWPVLSCFGVEAQAETNSAARSNAEKRLNVLMIISSDG